MTAEEVPSELRILLTAALKANVEKAAAIDGQSVNDWVTGQLDQAATVALQRAVERQALAEAHQKEVDARAQRSLDQMLKKHRGQ